MYIHAQKLIVKVCKCLGIHSVESCRLRLTISDEYIVYDQVKRGILIFEKLRSWRRSRFGYGGGCRFEMRCC